MHQTSESTNFIEQHKVQTLPYRAQLSLFSHDISNDLAQKIELLNKRKANSTRFHHTTQFYYPSKSQCLKRQYHSTLLPKTWVAHRIMPTCANASCYWGLAKGSTRFWHRVEKNYPYRLCRATLCAKPPKLSATKVLTQRSAYFLKVLNWIAAIGNSLWQNLPRRYFLKIALCE